jgi:hypothetical protein
MRGIGSVTALAQAGSPGPEEAVTMDTIPTPGALRLAALLFGFR